MDGKYDGCNIVESVVTAKESRKPEAKKNKSRVGGFIVRLTIAAAVIGLIVIMHFFPEAPVVGSVANILRKVFCYDMFGRTEFGAVSALFA